jgi:hypothetical protein
VLARQYLRQQFGSAERLRQVVTDCTRGRNTAWETIYWRFTTEAARTKLGHRYPPLGRPRHTQKYEQLRTPVVM